MSDITLTVTEQEQIQLIVESGGGEARTQSKTVTPSDAEQTVYPDAGYLLSSVKVEPCPPPQTQSKTVTSAINQQTVLPDDGYYLSSVTVDGMPSETASVTPTEQAQTVTPSEGKLLSEVSVGAIPSQYHDTSDADGVAADLKRGKIMYGADGRVVGTSDAITPTGAINITSDGQYDVTDKAEAVVNTKPQIGLVFTDFSFDGYPQSIYTYGYTTLPSDFLIDMGARNYQTRSYFSRLITNVYLNDELTRLGSSSLRQMNRVKMIRFPSALTRIDNYCWTADTYLELLDFSRCVAVPVLDITGNNGLPSGCVIRVPSALLSEWQSTDAWRDLTDVVWQGV